MSTMVSSELNELTIPDYSVWGRGDVSAYYSQIARAVSDLGKDILEHVDRTTSDGQRLTNDFAVFKREFGNAYTAYMASPILLPVSPGSTVVEQMRMYAGQYNGFESRFAALTGATPSYLPPHVATEQGGADFQIPTVVYVGLGVVALGFAAWGAASLSRFAPVLQPVAERFSYPRNSSPALHGRRIRR